MEEILKQFPNLTENQILQFKKLEVLYHDWNAKINVISRKDIDELYTKHVLHSLAIAKIQPFEPGTYILDVGTGGGFPGIPLAILFPETRFYLIDVIAKKIKVVQEVAKGLGLKVNSEAFLSFACSFDYSIVRKVSNNLGQLEALFFGQAGLLSNEFESVYFNNLKREYEFLKVKFNLEPILIDCNLENLSVLIVVSLQKRLTHFYCAQEHR